MVIDLDRKENILLNIEKLYNLLKFELQSLKFENRILKKEIKKLKYNKDEITSSSEEHEPEKKI